MKLDWQYDLYFDENIVGYPNYSAEVTSLPPSPAVWELFSDEWYREWLSVGVEVTPEPPQVGAGGWLAYKHIAEREARRRKSLLREEEEIMAVIMAFLHTRH